MNALLVKLLRFLDGRLAMNGASRRLVEMDLARLLGEFRPDIDGIGGELGAKLAQHGIGLGPHRRRWRDGLGTPLRHVGRHGQLLHLRAPASRAADGIRFHLLVKVVGRAEPGLEPMSFLASQCVADHDAP